MKINVLQCDKHVQHQTTSDKVKDPPYVTRLLFPSPGQGMHVLNL